MSAAGVISLSRRSTLNTLRQPQMWVPSMVFPLIFTAINTAAMGRATHLPGFPADSFLDFAVATAVLQGVLFGATAGGSDMAVDIQDGFFDRLVSSPVSRPAIVLGRLAGAGVLAAVQSVVFMGVLSAFGADIRGGAAAVVVIAVTSMLLAAGVGGITVAIALKTGSSEVVQATFPVLFISLFTSSAFFPRELMSGWFKAVASANPLSFMVESMRALILHGFDIADAARALAIVAVLAAASLTMCLVALRSRLDGA